MNDHKIQKSVKDVAAQAFVESAEQLGLIKGGVLCYSEDDTVVDDKKENCQGGENSNNETISNTPLIIQDVKPTSMSNESDYITQSIPFESGKIAKFIIPIDATEDDLLLLRDMFDVILKRKFKISI